MPPSRTGSHFGAPLTRGWDLLDYPADKPLADLAEVFGDPAAAREHGALPELLVPTTVGDASPRSLSAIYGLGEFPFHTDAAHHSVPPDLVLMRLGSGSVTPIPTIVFNLFDAVGDSTIFGLKGGSWIVRAGRRRFYTSIVVRKGGDHLVRFDPGCMKPVSPRAEEVEEIIASIIAEAPHTAIEWSKNMVLLLDNWRCLHGRPAANDSGRSLERILIRSSRAQS